MKINVFNAKSHPHNKNGLFSGLAQRRSLDRLIGDSREGGGEPSRSFCRCTESRVRKDSPKQQSSKWHLGLYEEALSSTHI